MAKFGEMSFAARLGVLVLAALIVGVAYYYVYLNPQIQANAEIKTKIRTRTARMNNCGSLSRSWRI